MRYSSYTECSLSLAPNTPNGTVGETSIYSISTKTIIYQTTTV